MGTKVGFLQGLQSALDTKSTGFQEGSFYLTTDTERLYYAKSTTKGGLVELNRSIRYISGSLLPTAEQYTFKDGDIFYIAGLNALVIRDNGSWTQINPDTFLKSSDTALSVATSGTGAVVGVLIEDTKGSNVEHSATGNFVLKPGSNVSITANSNTREITIGSSYTNTTYDLVTAAGSTANEALIKLVGTNPASTATVKVKADGTMVEVEGDASGNITIKGKKPITALNSQFDANGALDIEAVLNDGTTASTEIAPRIIYGESGSASAVFASGTATLDVYTREQVNNKIGDILRSADALIFKGVVSTTSDAASKLSATGDVAPKVGDTYKVTADLASIKVGPTASDTATANKGDLLIVTKDASENKYWTVVPSGDEEVVAFQDFDSTGNNAITIGSKLPEEANLSNAHSLVINGATSVTNSNNLIVVTPTVSGQTKTLTISHGKPAANSGSALTYTNGTAQSASGTKEIKTITSISFDSAGHITTATAEKFNVVDTHGTFSFEAITMSATSTNNSYTGRYGLETKFDGTSTTRTLAICSDSLVIGVNGTENAGLDINLEWGTF